MLPVVDIFAGPGGLGEGFTQAGFKVLVSAEMNPTACETLIESSSIAFQREKRRKNIIVLLRASIVLKT